MICFLTAGMVVATLATQQFTLIWMHSVEKIAWQEDWQVEDDRLIAVAARLQGSGAGMEPPADARLAEGWWHYRPTLPPLPRLVLSRSQFVDDYTICWNDACHPLSYIVKFYGDTSITIIEPCSTSRQHKQL